MKLKLVSCASVSSRLALGVFTILSFQVKITDAHQFRSDITGDQTCLILNFLIALELINQFEN